MMNSQVPLTPEILVSRLGEYLVAKKTITRQDLALALQEQKRLREIGQPKMLGQVLIQLGMIDKTTLDEAITEQILKLRAALQETNKQLERRVQERTAELQKALEKLSELSQLKSNIIANVSHEFRTPMTHCKGYLDLLLIEELGPLNPQQIDALNVMTKSLERLEQLIEDLLRFSAMSKGEFTLQIASIDLPKLCQSVIDRAMAKAKEREVQLIWANKTEIAYVKADREKIFWVLLQLLDNAIKFTPKDGKVVLSAESDAELVKISVSDTGIGIPAERIPELFEPFHQLDGTSTRRYGGTGLGLSLVRQIIEAHGSVIRVYSKEGQGTRFEFHLSGNSDRRVIS